MNREAMKAERKKELWHSPYPTSEKEAAPAIPDSEVPEEGHDSSAITIFRSPQHVARAKELHGREQRILSAQAREELLRQATMEDMD